MPSGFDSSQIIFPLKPHFFEIIFAKSLIDISLPEPTFKNDKGYFTVRELVDNIVEFEKEDRLASDWFGGVDTHHRFFEGIYKDKDAYRICWGS